MACPDCTHQTSKLAVHGRVCDLEYPHPSRLDRAADECGVPTTGDGFMRSIDRGPGSKKQVERGKGTLDELEVTVAGG